MGAAAWKNTSSGSMPTSLKKPFSTPTKTGAEEVSLSTPTLTLAGAWAEAGDASARPATAAVSRMKMRRMSGPSFGTGENLAGRGKITCGATG